jgi:hypothetical protein
MITEAGFLALLSVLQVVLIGLRAFSVITWPWWVVALPIEAAVAFMIWFVVYLMTTKGNPFQ